jgi:hypothetical protein
MKKIIFISYAWTSSAHREWVRLLAIQLRLLGYTVQIDSTVEYGASLSSFMREVAKADRVLMIVDKNYVERADRRPESGVGIENQWISSAFKEKPASWISVLFVNNPEYLLPAWLVDQQLKGFNFNSNPDLNKFPGIEQMDDLWRWVEGLPADKVHALPAALLLERTARIERIDAMRDPANYVSPAFEDRITFQYKDYAYYTLGHGEYEFKVKFSDRGFGSVYVYRDSGLKAIGLVTASNFDRHAVETFLRPGRTAEPNVGQSIVMMNELGALCVMNIEAVQAEVNTGTHVPATVTFSYQILVGR